MCVGSGSTRFSTDGFRLLVFCILILWHALTPHIQGGSRMRRSARTVLCGGYRAIGIPTATAKYLPTSSSFALPVDSPRARHGGNGQKRNVNNSRSEEHTSELQS